MEIVQSNVRLYTLHTYIHLHEWFSLLDLPAAAALSPRAPGCGHAARPQYFITRPAGSQNKKSAIFHNPPSRISENPYLPAESA
jgi:hypothetical protein